MTSIQQLHCQKIKQAKLMSAMVPWAIWLVLCPATACSHQQRQTFEKQVLEFNEAIRWKQYRVIEGSLRQDIIEKEMSYIRHVLRDVEIADFSVVSCHALPSGKRIEVLVKFTWYHPPNMSLKKGYEIQIWEQSNGIWYFRGRRPAPNSEGQPSPFIKKSSK